MPKKRAPLSLPRTPKQFIPWLIAMILLLAVGASQLSPDAAPKLINIQPGYYRVVEFFDGDTIAVDMNGVSEKIRLIGVDTPETHDPRKSVQCYGKQASEFTKNLIGNNPVRLEADPTNQNRDRYNRLLRYAYLPNGTLVNSELIKQGYGFAYTSFPFQKLEEFRELQRQAQEQNRGLWSTCEPQTNDFGGFTSNSL